jgi:hypothetical protein
VPKISKDYYFDKVSNRRNLIVYQSDAEHDKTHNNETAQEDIENERDTSMFIFAFIIIVLLILLTSMICLRRKKHKE